MVVHQRKDHVTVDQDEGIRPGTTAEGLGPAWPAFSPDGTITAGNASQISDGAAAVVVTSWSGRPPTAWRCSPRSWPTGPWPGPTPACTPSRRGPSPTPAGGPGSPPPTWPGRDQRGLRPRWRCARPASWSWTRPSSTSTAAPSPSATRSGQRRPGRAHPGHGAALPRGRGRRGRPVRRRRPGGRPAGPGRSRTSTSCSNGCGPATSGLWPGWISWVEDGDRDQLREAAEALNPATGRAQVIGPPGRPGSASRPGPAPWSPPTGPGADRRGAGRRPVLAVHRRGPARRPGG